MSYRRLEKETFIESGILSASRKWFQETTDTHWHDFYEMEYIISGTGCYEITGRSFPMEAGMFFFMTTADFHKVYANRAQLVNIMFDHSLVTSSYLAPFTDHTSVKAMQIPEDMRPFFLTLLEEIVAFQSDLSYSSALLDCLLLKLQRIGLGTAAGNENSTVQKIRFYMINHFRTGVTLDDVASYVNLTPTYVSALFKKEMNQNFKTYLDELRFSYARKLLLYSDLTVTEVCGESGFDDYPNFIRRFRKHYGVTPTQLRGTTPFFSKNID